MRPLLVGEANPYAGSSAMALYPRPRTSAGGRLCALLGLTEREYLRGFERINLFNHYYSERWSREEARWEAGIISSVYKDTPVIIMLGARVSEAFGLGDLPVWKFRDRASVTTGKITRFIRIPHPSGRCRVWNDPAAVRRLRRVLRPYLTEARRCAPTASRSS